MMVFKSRTHLISEGKGFEITINVPEVNAEENYRRRYPEKYEYNSDGEEEEIETDEEDPHNHDSDDD